MGRPPVIPVEQKTRIVLSGGMFIGEVAREEKVCEVWWKVEFVEVGKTVLVVGGFGPSSWEE